MGEPKPLASLSAGLLARKGGARPAMRRQPLGSGPAPTNAAGYDDLGWNDMGYDVDPDQSGEPARMLDLKPLLTGSVLAHNVEAEQTVSISLISNSCSPGDPMVRVLEASNKTKGSVERLGLSFYLLFVGERSPE